MADDASDNKAADTAEKAYAAAAQAKLAPTAAVTPPSPAPTASPAKPAAKASPVEPTVVETKPVVAKASLPETKAVAPAAKPVAAKPAAPKPAKVTKAQAPKARKSAARKVSSPKIAKQAAKPVPKTADIRAFRPVSKPVKITAPTPIAELKEKIMATAKTTTPDYTKLAKDIQGKAQAAYAKGSALASEAVELTKGNVEALVESGKILASGTQTLGKEYVAETKTAFDTMTADLKEMAAIKSPTELFQLQGKLARRNFDHAVALSSKSSESLLKLANEVFAPISNRVSLAVDKFSKVA